MKKSTVLEAKTAGLALLAAVSGVVLAQGVHADLAKRHRSRRGTASSMASAQCHFSQGPQRARKAVLQSLDFRCRQESHTHDVESGA